MSNEQLEFYIATDGCDTHIGSLEEPFRSFEKAIEVIKAHKTHRGKIIFWIRKGTYRLKNTLIFDEEIVMNPLLHICFSHYLDEEVTISGGVLLNLQWRAYKDSIKVADIGAGYNFDMLLMNGKPQVLCRYPNYIEDEILNGYSEQALSQERIATWENPKGGYIRALHEKDWGGNSYVIKGKTVDQQLIYDWVGDNNRGAEHSKAKVMVENIFEELDSEREWYYHSDTGKLYFYPPKEADLEQAIFEGATLETLFSFKGKSIEEPIQNITLQGLTFTCTHRTLFTRPYERPLRGDWAIARVGAIYMENTEGITIKECKFYNLGGNGIMMSAYNKGHVIDYNDMEDIGASGVLVVGLQKATRDPSTWGNHKTIIEDYNVGPKTEDYPRNIRITNNYIYNSGIYEKQSAGVCISISEHITVSKNTIHHVPRAGINISDGTFGGHIIEGNDLFDCVRETGDHGPFNSWGRDRFWSVPEYNTTGQFGKEKRPYALLDARSRTIIRNNRIHGNHAFGIDLDDGSSNYEIYNNLCLGVGIKTREGFDRKVYNNILVGCCFEIHCTYAMNEDVFCNNIIYNHKAYNFIAVNEGNTTQFKDNVCYKDGEVFNQPSSNDYSLKATSEALKLGFRNFPMTNQDFGRQDKPNPPIYVYIHGGSEASYYELEDAKLIDITDDGLRSATGLPDYKGTYLLDIPAIGWWVEEGFRTSDVIRKVNHEEIVHTEDFIRVYKHLKQGDDYEIEVYRNQTHHTLKIKKR